MQSTPQQLDDVWASGGVKKSTVSWGWYSVDLKLKATAFRVQARRNGGSYRTVKTVYGADSRSTVVRNLRKGKYRFRVRALNGSAVGPAKVAWATVRVRSRKLAKRYYTFRTRRGLPQGSVTTLRVMRDGTVHGIAAAGMEWGSLVGYLTKGRIKAKNSYGYYSWRVKKTGKWNSLRVKGQIRVKKSRNLSGHRFRSLFRQEIRRGVIPRN